MKLMKFDKNELPSEIKDALMHYGKTSEIELSQQEVRNEWIKFSNTLDFLEKTSQNNNQSIKTSFFNFRNLLPVISVFSTAAVLFYLIIQNSNEHSDSSPLANNSIGNVAISSASKDYTLPKPEKFSELVKFVKEEKNREMAELVVAKRSNKELDNDAYSRKLSAELEQSLRDSFPVESFVNDDFEPMETTLSSNLMKADIVDSTNIVYVSR